MSYGLEASEVIDTKLFEDDELEPEDFGI